MARIFAGHFDGKAIEPGGPVELPTGKPLKVTGEPAPRFADLLDLAADLPGAPSDLAARHGHQRLIRREVPHPGP